MKEDVSSLPTVSIAKEKLLEEIKQKEAAEGYKPVLSMVVVGKSGKLVPNRKVADCQHRTRRRWQIDLDGANAGRIGRNERKSRLCEPES